MKENKLYNYIIKGIISLQYHCYNSIETKVKRYIDAKKKIEKKLKRQNINPDKPKEIKNVKIQQAWYEFLSKNPSK